MTIILRSDRPSSRHLGNIFGIKGPMDFDALLDFNQGVYQYRDGNSFVSTTLEDAISLTRNTSGGYNDVTGAYQIAPANAPRIHYRSDIGLSGLLIEGARANLLANPMEPATQTISIPSTGLPTCVVLSIEGTGSATLSGELDKIESPAIQGKPSGAMLVNPGDGTSDVTVTITGNVTRFQLEKCAQSTGGGYASTFIPNDVTTRAADLVSLSPTYANAVLGTGAGTVVAQFIDHERRPLGMLAVYGVFSLQDTTKPKGGLYVSRNVTNASGARTISAKTVNPGTSTQGHNVSLALPDSVRNTFALGYGNNGAYMGLAVNGALSVTTSGTIQPIPNKLGLGSGDVFTAGSSEAGGILTRLVVYKRLLSQQEIITLSHSWL